MAKKSMIAREVLRKKINKRDNPKRQKLKAIIIDENVSDDDRFQAMLDLQKLSPNGSRIRQRNRCVLTGRPRGFYRRFGLGRGKLRELIMRGETPGVVKSSW